MTPRDRLFALEQFGIKLGLQNITLLLDTLKRPDRTFASVHVAGTNGKGSVTAMVERGLRSAGVLTGRYTSPHLDRIEERIAINGEAVTPEAFEAGTAEVMSAIERLRQDGAIDAPPTFFEAMTAIAFALFRRHQVQIAVIEVGLGGRFDATNVIVPMVSVITSIALDHEKYLGHTIAEIAFEKAGIIKRGVPVVVGKLPDEARRVVLRVAKETGAALVEADRSRQAGTTAVPLALQGAHQVQNAELAVATLRTCAAAGVPVRRHDIITGLSDVQWPGRLEWLRTDTGDLLIDAAHNPAGAEALANYVTDCCGAPLPLVLAVVKDKDVDAMIRALRPAASRFIATQVDGPRALPATDLVARVKQATNVPVEAFENADEAVATALGYGGRAIAAGSIFLIGPLRARLLRGGAAPVRYPSNASRFFLD